MKKELKRKREVLMKGRRRKGDIIIISINLYLKHNRIGCWYCTSFVWNISAVAFLNSHLPYYLFSQVPGQV
jgi:hypothetical protein